YLEERGILVTDLIEQGRQLLVVHAELDYRSPARYAEVLTIDTKLTQTGRSSLTFAHIIRERTSGRIVVEGSAKLVTVDLQRRVKRLEPRLLEALKDSPRRAP
ncbi:MAG: acyl-CoA thioesterase, partial [bacterium]